MIFHPVQRAKQLRSCPAVCDPMDCSPPGSSVHGILQARILEWVAISFSWGSSRPRDQILASYIYCIGRRVLYHQCHLGRLQTTKQTIHIPEVSDDSRLAPPLPLPRYILSPILYFEDIKLQKVYVLTGLNKGSF